MIVDGLTSADYIQGMALLTVDEAAARLNITPNALRSRYARGGIPSGIVVKIGKLVRYDEARLLAWIEECRT